MTPACKSKLLGNSIKKVALIKKIFNIFLLKTFHLRLIEYLFTNTYNTR